MSTKYTKEILQSAVNNSESFMGVLRFLGLRQAGGTQSHITNVIRKYQIDTSHFTGMGHNKGKVARNRKTSEEIFVVLPEGSPRTKTKALRRSLIEVGVDHQCAVCYTGTSWNGKPLTLEVDHIDGNWLNNLRENLRFICPNCHSQEATTNRPHKYR